jgi:hypothetical protein
VGVYISTLSNASSFNDFSPTLVKPFFKQTDAGVFCIPINLGAANVSGIADGANVTLQFSFDGGDGLLYQVCFLSLYMQWLPVLIFVGDSVQISRFRRQPPPFYLPTLPAAIRPPPPQLHTVAPYPWLI